MKANNMPVTPNTLSDSPLKIRIATHSWEKNEIYRLRYQVYVQEMDKALRPAIKKDNQVSDSLDNTSILLYAQSGREIIGTMRLTVAAAEDYPHSLAETFHMHTIKALSNNFPNPLLGLGTKLAVAAEYRNSPVLFFLLAEAYQIVRRQNVQFLFGGCNPSLIPLYERIGFRRFTRNFTDPGYGLLVPLAIVLEDIQHFRAIKSPIYRHARRYCNDLTIPQQFLQAFPETAKHINTQLASRESLWAYVQEKLLVSPYVIPPFINLGSENIMTILASGALFHCASGDCILYPNSLSNDIYILISGTLQATSPAGTRILLPGDHFGSPILSAQVRQTETVTALTESEVFVLPGQALARYQHLHPQAAEILVSNLTTSRGFAYACASLTEQGGKEND
ncbi:conserved hypothetical protein [uncultured Sporomusa sp.]|uniref:Cyclic nucleotide-binding domain-containing protein n=1 Tax=uncultured Sporomusa sp. TaxID=307249 RepID=A0A212LYI6_9FIRM|nr:cyclic nucleotide-binding domain-containing protein [uncultured Sporomusa sp.]SCM82550.1 conserved hypothetical protein [uncultured Sporomusa sp.]